MKKIMFSAAALMCFQFSYAQDSTKKENNVTISGYAEAYYTYDFNRPLNNTRPSFVYSHNRANEATVNLAFLKANFSNGKTRANLALAAGTYMNANLAAEPGVLKNIYEANAGVKISNTADLWIDAGIMPSHIGFESAIGKDNWTVTRSILADNSPYYEAGVKLGYTSKDSKLYLAAMYLNGWQRIQRVDGNTTPAFGTQLTYKPTSAVALNYSTFIGNDKPDSVRQMRYFNNLYAVFQLSSKVGITAGFDFGAEQVAKGSSDVNTWYSPIVILRYAPDAKNTLAFRGEYYSDEDGVIIGTGTPNGFKTYGGSINYDRAIGSNAVWRLEVRTMNSKDEIFPKRNLSTTDNSTTISTALAISF
ncbi:MAG: porin [Gloeobacteraceae cyanobacterium ES-bin-316]|nr:porin [Ferruginibacter sp.]